MANLSIYQNLLKPPKSIQEYDDEHAQRQVNMLGLKEKQNALAANERGLADELATREVYAQSAGDQSKVLQTLKARGLYKPAMSIEKSILDAQKTTQEIEGIKAKTGMDVSHGKSYAADAEQKAFETKLKAIEHHTQSLDYLQTPKDVSDYIDGGVRKGLWDPEKAAIMKQRAGQLSSVEEFVAASKQNAIPLLEKFKAEQEMRKAKLQSDTSITTTRMGNETSIATNAATNAQSNVNSQRTAASSKYSTDSAATNSRLSREQSATHHKDAMGKPFEVTGPEGTPILVQQNKQGNIVPVSGYGPKAGAEKPLTDAQSKAALFGSRMESSDKVLESLAGDGTTTSVPGARAGFGVGATLNVLSSAKQQQLEQAKRDFVNAVLRRESGAVITESEFNNAEKQYFPQIGDSKAVKDQKQNNRAIAIRGVQAEVPKAQKGVLREIQDGKPSQQAKTVNFGDLK